MVQQQSWGQAVAPFESLCSCTIGVWGFAEGSWGERDDGQQANKQNRDPEGFVRSMECQALFLFLFLGEAASVVR